MCLSQAVGAAWLRQTPAEWAARVQCSAQAEGIADTVTDIALAQLVSKTDLRDALAHLKIDLLKFGAMAAQTALIVALIELLK